MFRYKRYVVAFCALCGNKCFFNSDLSEVSESLLVSLRREVETLMSSALSVSITGNEHVTQRRTIKAGQQLESLSLAAGPSDAKSEVSVNELELAGSKKGNSGKTRDSGVSQSIMMSKQSLETKDAQSNALAPSDHSNKATSTNKISTSQTTAIKTIVSTKQQNQVESGKGGVSLLMADSSTDKSVVSDSKNHTTAASGVKDKSKAISRAESGSDSKLVAKDGSKSASKADSAMSVQEYESVGMRKGGVSSLAADSHQAHASEVKKSSMSKDEKVDKSSAQLDKDKTSSKRPVFTAHSIDKSQVESLIGISKQGKYTSESKSRAVSVAESAVGSEQGSRKDSISGADEKQKHKKSEGLATIDVQESGGVEKPGDSRVSQHKKESKTKTSNALVSKQVSRKDSRASSSGSDVSILSPASTAPSSAASDAPKMGMREEIEAKAKQMRQSRQRRGLDLDETKKEFAASVTSPVSNSNISKAVKTTTSTTVRHTSEVRHVQDGIKKSSNTSQLANSQSKSQNMSEEGTLQLNQSMKARASSQVSPTRFKGSQSIADESKSPKSNSINVDEEAKISTQRKQSRQEGQERKHESKKSKDGFASIDVRESGGVERAKSGELSKRVTHERRHVGEKIIRNVKHHQAKQTDQASSGSDLSPVSHSAAKSSKLVDGGVDAIEKEMEDKRQRRKKRESRQEAMETEMLAKTEPEKESGLNQGRTDSKAAQYTRASEMQDLSSPTRKGFGQIKESTKISKQTQQFGRRTVSAKGRMETEIKSSKNAASGRSQRSPKSPARSPSRSPKSPGGRRAKYRYTTTTTFLTAERQRQEQMLKDQKAAAEQRLSTNLEVEGTEGHSGTLTSRKEGSRASQVSLTPGQPGQASNSVSVNLSASKMASSQYGPKPTYEEFEKNKKKKDF